MLNFDRKIVKQQIFFGLYLNAWITILLLVKVEMKTILKQFLFQYIILHNLYQELLYNYYVA